MKVSDIMTHPVVTVTPETRVGEATTDIVPSVDPDDPVAGFVVPTDGLGAPS